ncbi:MAG: DNA polymerase III subunit [Elusimicrobiota bacterium]
MQIIGHKKQVEMLFSAVNNKKVHSAYLFVGQVGIGKKLVALEFAKMLNCQNKTSSSQKKACGECISCRKIESATHPDVITIPILEDKSWISIDQIRDMIKGLQFRAVMGGYNVRIIDDAHLIKEESASALLKILEEPPTQTVIILITSIPGSLPRTIISRCVTVHFSTLSDAEIKNEIRKYNLTDEELNFITSVAIGSLGKALEFVNDKDLISEYRNVFADFINGHYTTKKFNRKEVIKFLDILASQTRINNIQKLENVLRIKNYIRRNANISLALEVLRMSLSG